MVEQNVFHITDLDDIYIVLGDNMEENHEFNEELNQKVNEVTSIQDTTIHTCNYCEKSYASARGLKRHVKAKHTVTEEQDSCYLNLLEFKEIIEESAQKLLQEDLYPTYTKELEQFKIITDENKVMPLYNHVKMTIKRYRNELERFYPTFYKKISEFEFLEVSRQCGLILGYQAADCIAKKITNSNSDNEHNGINSGLNKREISIVCYISGYVLVTLYRRVFFKAKNAEYYNNYLKMPSLCRLEEEGEGLSQAYDLITAKDRGGLWKVKSNALSIFLTAENYFRNCVSKNPHKIESHAIISDLLENSRIRIFAQFSDVLECDDEQVNTELKMNLLEDISSLYTSSNILICEGHKRNLNRNV